ncbi:MAG: CPBP family intramembrane metalloprotease [Candidatus Marinimicrobia bacterium]|nr:CPBP family intramembrane metalloprotease [Candidatus Neomarinimicrobiota bacterium]
MTRKPIFWIGLIILFIVGAIFSFYYFDKANPIVNLDIKMDRESALEQALKISEKFDLGPNSYRQAATFTLDNALQNYVELELGGAAAFNEVISGDLYSPFTWQVRHFKPEETNEVTIFFKPSGEFYGFAEKIPEDQPGSNIAVDTAVALARQFATENDVNLTPYTLVENSQETQPCERIDHTLVYERNHEKLKEATYRLRIKISGDKITEYRHFVKIPETFTRQYDEMRSTNNTIATIATVAAAVLYIFGGCIFGLFVLLRQNRVLWKTALFWGFFIALLQVLVQINNWPLMWMNYDTAIAVQGFLMQQIVQLLVLFIAEFLLLTLTFMAAESLGRKAFPGHLQFWKIWSADVAPSQPVYGQTAGGYFAVTLFFAFDVALYFFTTKILGWWVPSSILFDPNILATHMPWFDAIAQSLHAGFWEESLFRAVPIAGAALIGSKYGRRNLWIAIAFIVQALVFGAAHANYPMQPSYARIIELIVPSIAFGLLYLNFGLLPGILLHFAYDVIWFSLPLFSSSAQGLLVDKLLVILLTFVPLGVLFWRRIQAGKSLVLVSKEHYNQSWQPTVKAGEDLNKIDKTPQNLFSETTNKQKSYIIVAGIIALVLWFISTDFSRFTAIVKTDRKAAVATAVQELKNRNIVLSDSVTTLSVFQESDDQDDKFIWQVYGKETYKKLLGNYLHQPYWLVRFAQFEGTVNDRAEEYQVFIEKGKTIRLKHLLPEAAVGDSLSEQEARKRALQFIDDHYQIDSEYLQELTASPSRLPHRTDWNFEFADTINYNFSEGGKAVIVIHIAGHEIVDSFKKIQVPEKWEREEKNRSHSVKIIKIISMIVFILTFLTALVLAIISWSKGRFSVRIFLSVLVLIALVLAVSFINSWPLLLSQMQTALPLSNQKILFGIAGFFSVLLAFVPALIFGFIKNRKQDQVVTWNYLSVLSGIAAGLVPAAISAFLTKFFGPNLQPNWSDYTSCSNYLPFISSSINFIQRTFLQASLLFFIFLAFEFLTKKMKVHYAPGIVLLLLYSFIISGTQIESVSFWILSGLVLGVFYILLAFFFIRDNIFLLLLVTAGNLIPGLFREIILQPYKGSRSENILALILLLAVSIFYFGKLCKKEH